MSKFSDWLQSIIQPYDQPEYTGLPTGSFGRSGSEGQLLDLRNMYQGQPPMGLPGVKTFAGFTDAGGGLLGVGNISQQARQMSQGVPQSRFLNPGPAWQPAAPALNQPLPGLRVPSRGLLG